MSESETVQKEMGFSHEEIFRILPRAFADFDYTVDGPHIVVRDGARHVEMTLHEETERALGGIIRLPVTRVDLAFHGYEAEAKAGFLEHFRVQFFKGGG